MRLSALIFRADRTWTCEMENCLLLCYLVRLHYLRSIEQFTGSYKYINDDAYRKQRERTMKLYLKIICGWDEGPYCRTKLKSAALRMIANFVCVCFDYISRTFTILIRQNAIIKLFELMLKMLRFQVRSHWNNAICSWWVAKGLNHIITDDQFKEPKKKLFSTLYFEPIPCDFVYVI